METVSKLSRHRRTAGEIKIIVEEFRASGQSMTAFCLHRGITKNSLSRWVGRRETQKNTESSAFSLLQLEGSSAPYLFAEVNGIRIYQPVSASFLKELVA